MRKYAEYYYTTRKEKQGYSWAIRNVEGEVLQHSEEFFTTKELAETSCEEHIQEYYS